MTELHDLSEADQTQLMREITAARCERSPRAAEGCEAPPAGWPRSEDLPPFSLSRAVQKTFAPKKVNVGMLGNMCAQCVPAGVNHVGGEPSLAPDRSVMPLNSDYL